jgi:hypothetical protein
MNEFMEHIRNRFVDEFYKKVGTTSTLKEAYEATEEQFRHEYGHECNVFAHYESFKVIKCRVLQVKRRNK